MVCCCFSFFKKGIPMKKATPEYQESPRSADEEQPLAPVIPIRTETTLTRYPIHRIAKKGEVKIKQTARNAHGKLITNWEVKHPPGPLAYKLDTLIINRRIDAMRNRGEIKQLFKVGSLSEISRELGFADSGKNRNAIKEALKENAGALITARIDYKGVDGTEREFEFTTTRYTVIFTGEKLPNDKKADAVYIELHPRYHEMLKHSKTRPLDYEYLRELPPSSQRLYELLSFTMYGTLKHGRPNVQTLYSEFCKSAPLTRYYEWDKVRPQMWKIHKPHIDTGYIKSVEFEETTDAAGAVDWLIKYTPGRKAKHEFREFSKKGIEHAAAKARFVVSSRLERSLSVVEDNSKSSQGAKSQLIERLCAAGFNRETAKMLATKHPKAAEQELDAWPEREKAGMKNPLGWLRKAIETGDFALPVKPEPKKSARKAIRETDAKKSREERYNELYMREYLAPFAANLPMIDAEAFQVYQERCDRIDSGGAELPEEARTFFKLWELADMAQYWPEIGLLKLDEWLRKEHPEAFAG